MLVNFSVPRLVIGPGMGTGPELTEVGAGDGGAAGVGVGNEYVLEAAPARVRRNPGRRLSAGSYSFT